ncbi:MAG: hypothetical protein JNM18_04775 [Planctomycetaceae bacterium]|nr:hypothetical protein [Planctomycetaceae bacterium]
MNRLATNRRCLSPRESRRGSVSGALVVGLVVGIGLMAISLNVGQVYQTRDQLKLACEAAALAGAAELLDESKVYGVEDQQTDYLAARLAAQTIAGRHLIHGQPLSLDANVGNDPAGDILIGHTPSPGAMFQPVLPHDGRGRCNAIVVSAYRHANRGNAAGMWFGHLFGSPTANISCSAQACIDHRVIGFRPKGATAAPVLPILLEGKSWHDQRQGARTQWNDRFTINYQTNEHREGADGVIELEFRCPLGESGASASSAASGTQAQHGRCALFVTGGNHADTQVVYRQCQTGFVQNELQPWNGQLVIPREGELNVTALENAEQYYSDSLWAIRGQRRVFPLCVPYEQAGQGGRWAITEFVAGVVVDSYVDFSQSPRQLVVCVQPGVIATSTAVTDPSAAEHPSIAKLLLTHSSN